MDTVEFDRAECVDEQSEHAAAADGGELQRVADQRDPPAFQVGQIGEFGEFGGRHHAGLVDDHRGADREVVAVVGWTVETVFDQQLVERVGHQPGLVGQHLGRRRRRGDAEHGSPISAQLGDGRSEGGGLAGAGRADDEHDVGRAGDSGRGFGLGGVEVQSAASHGLRFVDAVVGQTTVDPVDQRRLLVEDRLGRERTVDDRFADWATVLAQQRIGLDRLGDVDAVVGDDVIGELVRTTRRAEASA